MEKFLSDTNKIRNLLMNVALKLYKEVAILAIISSRTLYHVAYAEAQSESSA